MRAPFLSIKSVSKKFGAVTALAAVSLEIYENEFFALLGPSGCGKTTLLRALAGFESLDSGEVSLAGEDLLSVPANKRPVNLMFQSYALFPHMNVYENIAYGPKREKLPKDEVESRVRQVIATVGLTQLEARMPSQLSGGQKQRVALARAIVKRPKILLLDEPLSALDRKVRSEMQFELKRLQHEAGITFVLVTHDQEEAMSMADRIAVMNNGLVEQISTPIELYTKPTNRFVADFIGTSNLISGTIEGSELVTATGAKIPINPQGRRNGERVIAVIRPESFVISPAGYLTGTVVGSNFYGGSSVLVIDCGLEKPLKVEVPFDSVPAVGAICGISWDTLDVLVLTDG